jgi:hypothetical protein
MRERIVACTRGGLLLVAMAASACSNPADHGTSPRGTGVFVSSASAAERDDDSKERTSIKPADSSPFVVGVWKFVKQPGSEVPTIDTEFRFINPTNKTLTLEYAFFEADGTFCGCDRDDFPPNKTTEYTMLDETQLAPPLPNGPAVFSCKGTSGALKSIVFKSNGHHIFLDDAEQIGFQTHAFGSISESDQAAFLTGTVMTEAPLQGIALNPSTREEIRAIHERCNTVNGPL